MSASTLETIAARLRAGERLTDEETTTLASTSDIVALGMLAEEARRQRHGDRVTFLRVAHVTLQSTGGEYSFPDGAGEVRLVGTASSLEEAIAAVRSVVARADGVPVTAFTLGDLGDLAGRERVRVDICLARLREAGLERVVEASLDSPHLDELVEAAAQARIGIPRFVLDRAGEGWVERIRRVTRMPRTEPPVRALAPLTRRVNPAAPTTGYEDLKRVAIARLIADNMDTIQVDWSGYGPKLAQVALMFGADDLDDVPAIDDLSLGPRRAPLEEVRRNIRAAALIPVERNARWELVG